MPRPIRGNARGASVIKPRSKQRAQHAPSVHGKRRDHVERNEPDVHDQQPGQKIPIERDQLIEADPAAGGRDRAIEQSGDGEVHGWPG
jgi:hypothetical protein